MSGDPQHLAEILAQLKATTKLGAHLDHAQIWERWNEIAGTEFAPRSHPIKVRKGILTVAALSPVWLHKISYEKRAIIDRINRVLMKESVEDLYLTLPSDEDLASSNPPENTP